MTIALVGKYTKLADSYTSVIKALEHSALAINHKLEVKVSIIFPNNVKVMLWLGFFFCFKRACFLPVCRL